MILCWGGGVTGARAALQCLVEGHRCIDNIAALETEAVFSPDPLLFLSESLIWGAGAGVLMTGTAWGRVLPSGTLCPVGA